MPVAVTKNKDMNDNAIKYSIIKNARWVYDPLKLRNLNLFLCRHLDRISDRLLRVVSLSDLKIAVFSSRHKLQRPLLYIRRNAPMYRYSI